MTGLTTLSLLGVIFLVGPRLYNGIRPFDAATTIIDHKQLYCMKSRFIFLNLLNIQKKV